MTPTFKLRNILIAIGLGLSIQANAQWWNPLAPKTMEECILQNMKGVTSNDAAGLVAQACARKFPKEESEEGKKKKKLLERCDLDADSWKSRYLFSIDGKLNPEKSKEFVSKIKRLSFNAQKNSLRLQNNNSFGLSTVQIGFSRGKTCSDNINDYEATVVCGNALTTAGIGPNSYGTFACNEVPHEVSGYGFCVIGISPIYDQFNDDLPNWMLANGYCK